MDFFVRIYMRVCTHKAGKNTSIRDKKMHVYRLAGMIAGIGGKKSHVYRVIILKQMADHRNRRLFISPVYLCRETTIHSEILQTNVQNKAPKSYRFKNAKISIPNGKIGHKYTLNCGKKCAFLSPAFT